MQELITNVVWCVDHILNSTLMQAIIEIENKGEGSGWICLRRNQRQKAGFSPWAAIWQSLSTVIIKMGPCKTNIENGAY